MAAYIGNNHNESFEHITNRDLLDSARLVLGSIDLDPASSSFANDYVQATNYYTPKSDGLNDQQWYGNVYLFPPRSPYFFDKKNNRWKPTRGLSPTLRSGHELWWRTLKKKWLSGEVESAIYFTNVTEMIMYAQDIFDHPVCILKNRPSLIRRYYADDRIMTKNTSTCMVVYLQPRKDITESARFFQEIYSEKGRILM